MEAVLFYWRIAAHVQTIALNLHKILGSALGQPAARSRCVILSISG
jgi:hypothetical protein